MCVTTPSRNIFVTNVTQADGTFKSVITSQALSDKSIRVNSPGYLVTINLLMTLMQSHDLNPNPFIKIISNCALHFSKFPPEILTHIFGYLLPINHPQELLTLGAYGTAVSKPTLFPRLNTNPSFVVDAAMRGQEDILLNILRADPAYLLKPAEVENVIGVKSIRKPLQAAIMATDVQLIEQMKAHFEQIPHGLTIMYEQILTIYKESLRVYYDKQQAIVEQLTVLQTTGSATPVDLAALTLAKTRSACYLRALQNNGNPNYDDRNYLNIIIAAHDKAQEDNTFDFQPYIDAICNAPQTALDDVMELINADTDAKTQASIAKGVSPIEIDFTDQKGRTYTREEVQALPFSELTLLQKMNRLREKLVEHRQQEIISNPHHIIRSGELNIHIWDEVYANRINDANYEKRSIIFSQVYGLAQVTAEEAVRQDLRQIPYYCYFWRKEARHRLSNFNNMVCDDYRDVSLVDRSSVDGWGYKFAASINKCARCLPMQRPDEVRHWIRTELISIKNDGLSALVEQLVQECNRKPEAICKIH